MFGKITLCLAVCFLVSNTTAQADDEESFFAGYGYDSQGLGSYGDYDQGGYGPQVFYYYAGPTSYQGSEPTSYYSSPAPVVYYGYYVAPTASDSPRPSASSPASYSDSTVAVYYYGYYVAPAPQDVPSPYYSSPSGSGDYSVYYAATSPSSYYYVPESAAAHYGGYVQYSYSALYTSGYGYGAAAAAPAAAAPAPSTCPSCPTCALSGSSHAAVTTHESAKRSAGTCYCPYDHDWKVWAVADPRCRATLLQKCDKDSRLPCAWLDQYFSAVPSEVGFKRPHEQDIFTFLYNDCPAAPPCSCSGLQFVQSDSPAQLYTCCSDLQLYAQVPFSGLSGTAVDAFCGSGQRASEVRAWVQHSLWHTTCPASIQPLYTYVSDSAVAALAAAQPAASQTQALQPAATSAAKAPSRQRFGLTNAVLMSGLVGAAGGALVAAVAMLVHSRRQHSAYVSLA